MNRGRPREFDKQAALRSAMLIFWKQGYRHTSIHDLTTELGISRPSLYAAFGDKKMIFRSVLDLYVQDYGQAIVCRLDDSPEIMLAVQGFLRDSVHCFTDQALPGGCLVAVHASDTELEEEIRVRLSQISQLTENALTKRFRVAIESGEIDSRHSASRLAGMTYCLLAGLSHATRTGSGRRKLNGIVECFLESLANLID